MFGSLVVQEIIFHKSFLGTFKLKSLHSGALDKIQEVWAIYMLLTFFSSLNYLLCVGIYIMVQGVCVITSSPLKCVQSKVAGQNRVFHAILITFMRRNGEPRLCREGYA